LAISVWCGRRRMMRREGTYYTVEDEVESKE
jgi:hypothetical protein